MTLIKDITLFFLKTVEKAADNYVGIDILERTLLHPYLHVHQMGKFTNNKTNSKCTDEQGNRSIRLSRYTERFWQQYTWGCQENIKKNVKKYGKNDVCTCYLRGRWTWRWDLRLFWFDTGRCLQEKVDSLLMWSLIVIDKFLCDLIDLSIPLLDICKKKILEYPLLQTSRKWY